MSNCPPALEFASPNRPRVWIATRRFFAQLLVWAMIEACKLERGLGSFGRRLHVPFLYVLNITFCGSTFLAVLMGHEPVKADITKN